jgi:quinol monooxygenase YgiN
MIHVVATIELNHGKREAFLAEFRTLVPLVRAEDGCIEYGPTVDAVTDITAQLTPRPDVVVVVEQWESVEHLKRHLGAPHMADYRERVEGLVAGMTLVVLSPA